MKNIEDIRPNDLVWAENPNTGHKHLKKVVQTFVKKTEQLVTLNVEGQKITTTPEHPFYVLKKGWMVAAELCTGDQLVSLSGKPVIIESIQHEILEVPVPVYNFEVEDFHTYFVGSSSVLVHNTCMRHTPDQQALLQLGKEVTNNALRNGRFISFKEAQILDSWALEYGIPQHHPAQIGSGLHWDLGYDHTHLFGRHIPFK